MSEQPGLGSAGTGAAGGAPMSERMQALLSRAVEDQLTEQRQLASLVAEVRAMLAALPGEVAAAAPADEVLRAESTRMRTGLTAIEQRLEVLTAAAERPQDTSALTAQIAGVGSRVDALDARLAALESRLTELAGLPDAIAASERRVAAHVDEAVLALAEVMVRRSRPPAGASVRGASPVAPAAVMETAAREAADEAPAEDPTPPDAAVDVAVTEDAGTDEYADLDEPSDLDEADEDEADEADEDALGTDDELDDEDEHELDEDDEEDEEEDAASPPAMAAPDPWTSSSPFQPGPPREAQGAAAAIAELQADGSKLDEDEDEITERPRRKPWWRPGD